MNINQLRTNIQQQHEQIKHMHATEKRHFVFFDLYDHFVILLNWLNDNKVLADCDWLNWLNFQFWARNDQKQSMVPNRATKNSIVKIWKKYWEKKIDLIKYQHSADKKNLLLEITIYLHEGNNQIHNKFQ